MADRLLTPEEVARLFRVDSRTVSRWAKQGLFPPGARLVTPGGHNRFWESKIREMMEDNDGIG